ncbi:hypothetical protein L7F22_017200 [Adiantum nelumboides]|nr:hypothetical protein [Adiantum nelumboides]
MDFKPRMKKLVQDPWDAQVTDTITWTSLVAGLKACGGVGALKRGQVMHAEISKRGLLEKDVIANAAISMYSKWGQISKKDSTKLRTRDMNSCDVVSPADFQEGGKQCFWERIEATLRKNCKRSTKNELERVKLELAGKKVDLENEKLAKLTMIQALNGNAVKLKNQRGQLSSFSMALDGHKMAVGNERLANRLHWVEGDQLRSEAREAVRDMLTGDSLDVANNVQRKLGPIDVPAQLFPEDKVELLK